MALIALFGARTGCHFEQGDGYELNFLRLFSGTGARRNDLKLFAHELCGFLFSCRQNAEHVFTTKAGAFPEKPTGSILGNISQSDVAVSGRFEGAAFPT